jgi:hypothetical protein
VSASLAAGLILAAVAGLSHEEEKAGWRLLFDGETTAGWRHFGGQDPPGERWSVKDGTLHCAAGDGNTTPRGDIITRERFVDFDLRWEWRLAVGGNGGLKYFVDESRGKPLAHEYQLLDDDGHKDGKNGPHRQTGSLYDVLPPAADKPARPPGEWNESRLLVEGKHVEHWLNGRKILEYELGSDAFRAAIAKSKFKDMLDYGTKIETPILIQDHGFAASFRNIKVLSPLRP